MSNPGSRNQEEPSLADYIGCLSAPQEAPSILRSAAEAIDNRAVLRDSAGGERSMAKAVSAFNLMFGKDMTETQGWQFMELLKMARSSGGSYHEDDFIDGAAYAALAGESAGKEGM